MANLVFKKGIYLLALSLSAGCWAANFPIDSIIAIPAQQYPTEEIKVPIVQMDSTLSFFTTPGTLSCPGSSTGDFKNMVKMPSKDNPDPKINYPLWTATMQCDATPNSYSSHFNYYEYEFKWRGKQLYLTVPKFVGPKNYQSGTLPPPLNFEILIDTVSHLGPPMNVRKLENGNHIHGSFGLYDMVGRRFKSEKGVHLPCLLFEVQHDEIKDHK